MDFRYAVCPANLHAHDLSFSQQLISRLFTDAQSRTHFLDIHNKAMLPGIKSTPSA